MTPLADDASVLSLSGEPADPFVGTIVNGKYRVLSVVAKGGMGKIYRAEQLPLGRTVAFKVLNSQYTSTTNDSAFQKRFLLEASMLAKLQHPNIVTVFDYGRVEGLGAEMYFMTMEFLEGITLQSRLKETGPLPVPVVFYYARQIARGLREAHRRGIAHRDLKPSNIMLLRQDEGMELVKLLDFGLVKVLSDDSDQITKDGVFLGSPRYMSPEQISHAHVDHRTDIYSLGVILYETLCGLPPFESNFAVHTLMRHLQSSVPPMHRRNPKVQVPAAVERFVLRCLEKSPEQRPESMDAFVRELRECEKALGIGSSSQDESVPEISSAPRALSTFKPLIQDGLEDDDWESDATEVQTRLERPWVRNKLLIGLGIAGLAVIAGTFIGLRSRHAQSSAQGIPSASSAPAQALPLTHTVWIDSMPTGAEVLDGEQHIGTTPLQLTIDNAAVAAQPKLLTVRLSGYQPYSFVQGPSRDNVRVVAPLMTQSTAAALDAGPEVHSPKYRGGKGHKNEPEKPSDPPPATTEPDIQMTR